MNGGGARDDADVERGIDEVAMVKFEDEFMDRYQRACLGTPRLVTSVYSSIPIPEFHSASFHIIDTHILRIGNAVLLLPKTPNPNKTKKEKQEKHSAPALHPLDALLGSPGAPLPFEAHLCLGRQAARLLFQAAESGVHASASE